MAVSSFSPLTPRFCAWCQTPLQGRSDKKFCTDTCRSQVQRHGVPAPPTDWPAQLAAAEARVQELQGQLDQHAQAQQAARPFDDAYDNLVRLVGLFAQALDDEQRLADSQAFLDQQLRYYAQHPGLVTGEAPAHQRLLILQQVRDVLADRQRSVALLRAHQQSRQQATGSSAAVAGPTLTASTTPLLPVQDPGAA